MTGQFLDRLIRRRHDPDHKANGDCGRDPLRLLRKNLQEDLDALLNTRQMDGDRINRIPPAFDEILRSVMLHGLPDFSEQTKPSLIEKMIEKTLVQFEPRLRVSVHHEPAKDVKDTKSMSFRISARLQLNGSQVPLGYEPVIKVELGQCRLERAAS